jgi:hypothetical protein
METDNQWPNSWPPPNVFFQSLQSQIVSVHSRDLLIGHQIIVRFFNKLGAFILHGRLQEGLSEVWMIQFIGPGVNDFNFVFDRHISDLTWMSIMQP